MREIQVLTGTPHPASSSLGASLLSFCHSEAAAPMGISVVQVCCGVSDLKDSWEAEREKGEQGRASQVTFQWVQKQWLGLALGAGYSEVTATS